MRYVCADETIKRHRRSLVGCENAVYMKLVAYPQIRPIAKGEIKTVPSFLRGLLNASKPIMMAHVIGNVMGNVQTPPIRKLWSVTGTPFAIMIIDAKMITSIADKKTVFAKVITSIAGKIIVFFISKVFFCLGGYVLKSEYQLLLTVYVYIFFCKCQDKIYWKF